MTSLVRIRPLLRLAAFVAALCALLAPATAGASVHAHAAAKKKKAKPPVVTSVRPMNVEIGQTLEIRGKYFIRGRYKNTVAFKRDGGRAVFAKAKIGTAKMLRVTVPAKLKNEFKKSGFFYVPTRFRIRVLSKKFGKKFTAPSKSPVVALKPGTSPVAVTPPAPPVSTSAEGDCDHDGTVNSKDADDDNDLLPDDLENAINATMLAKYGSGITTLMDTCSTDSDGDGVEDGYEYQSARDLNDDEYQSPNAYLPYPGKRPYAEPARQGRRGHGPRRRQPDALARSRSCGSTRTPSRASTARSTSCTTPTASSTRSTRAVAPTAAACRRWPPRATTSRSTSRTGSRPAATSS